MRNAIVPVSYTHLDVYKRQVQDPQYRILQDRLQEKFQTQVKLDEKQIVIRYHGTDDLNRLLEILGCLEEE